MTQMVLLNFVVLALAIGGMHCDSDCRQTNLGTDYRGTKSTTISGFTCQRWDSTSPHNHNRNDVNTFPEAVNNDENYCRNPDKTPGVGPWCYTTNPDVRWEPCGIELCLDCKFTTLGTEYRGPVATTKSGRECQAWDVQTPHKHTRNNVTEFPNAKFNVENFCRNPDNEPEGPWCYTTDPNTRWEYCDIPICENCKTSPKGEDYSGDKSTTISGLTCQQWCVQEPHKHSFGSLADQANFCRNPDGEYGGPWCYTTHPYYRWETCGIPICPAE